MPETEVGVQHARRLWVARKEHDGGHYLEIQGWYLDNLNTAAIWAIDRAKLHITKGGKRDGFVWVKIKNAT